MSKQKHTPGPWKANLYLGGAYAIDRIAPNGDRLARVATVDGALETMANARLIAAAPDLLEVVKKCARLHTGRSAPPPAILVEALAAIAKVEGRA